MIVVETKRLVLRHFCIWDAEAMKRVFGDAEVMRFGEGVQTTEWVHGWLRRCLENHQRKSGIGPWAVVEKSSTETIGYCGLFHFPDVCGQPETEIGYRLARPYWGRGIATEAVLAVRDYAFNALDIPRLISMIDPENAASIRVAEKAGMQYENDVMFEGYTHPDHVYAIARPIKRTAARMKPSWNPAAFFWAAILPALFSLGCGTGDAPSDTGTLSSNDTDIVIGGIYSVDNGDGQFGVVKMLAFDDFAVHVRIYKNKFSERPKTIDTSTLSLGGINDPDGFGIGHAPFSETAFQKWNPVLLATEPVSDDELEGYKLYLEAMNEP